MSSTSGVNSLLSSTQTVPTYSISDILAASSGSSTTGIDVTAAVAAAIYADRAEERGWQADQTTLTGQTSALTTIQTATQAVNTDLESLNSLTGPLSARTVATSDSNAVTATAAAGTTLGNHTVEVNSTASTGSWYSAFQPSAISTLPAGSFTLTTTAGSSQTFQTGTASGAAGASLNDLATSINAANLGVTATVVSDSSGSALSIVANSSGAAADFSISEPYTSWSAPTLTSTETLGANSITLTGATATPSTATITTTTGETYAQLATAINSATGETPSTSSSSTQTSLASTTALTAGSVTTISDGATGKIFSYTANPGDTVATLNSAIASAVTAGTLSPNVSGALVGGQEVISEGSTDKGIKVTSNDSVLGTMSAAPGTAVPLGLTATAITDPATGNQSLTIVSSDGSTPFTINEPSSTPGTFGFMQAIAGADASITVDGVPLTSGSNTVTGAIPGVTLNLLGAAPGETVNLGVQSNASAVSTAINQLVSDYNTAINLVTSQFTVSSTTNSSGAATNSEGVLASDSTVVSLQSALEGAINYLYTPASGTTTVTSLNSLGITSNPDGTLSVDTTTLNNAITNNPTDVQNFFEGPSLNGFANSFSNSLNTYTDPANGAFTVDLHSISAESSSITSEINNFETNYIAAQQTILTAEYSSAEVALQQLPEEMQQLNSELGFNNSGSNG